MNRDDLIWLAGWLEGEGTFYYIHSSVNSAALKIQAFSTDRDVIEKVARLLGDRHITTIPPRECRGTQWKSNGGNRTELGGEPAAALMRALLPFMGLRRTEQIKKALARWDANPNRHVEKLCACGCGRTVVGGYKVLYARETAPKCRQRAFRARHAA